MRILHTADVHLREDDPKTVAALEAVLAKAEENDVDLLTIGGDLFDTPGDAEALRSELRELLKDNPFDILAIPGNHDEDVYRKSLHFGNDIEILTETPYETVEIEGVEIIGVPFTSSMTEELFTALQQDTEAETQILLLHCTLDIGFSSGALGEEEGKYFPVTRATLAELDYDYVLAGHIHSTDREVPLDNGGTFIYPGSPVSHSTKEEGKRHAVLIDTDTEAISTVALDTFYYDSFSKMVRPGEEDEILEQVRKWVDQRAGDNCELEVAVDGFIDREEETFSEELAEAAAPVDPRDDTRSAQPVLQHHLYRRFESRLEEKEDIEDEEMVKTRVIKVLSKLLADNRVQSS